MEDQAIFSADINSLPVEVLEKIFKHLDLQDRISAACVCRLWRDEIYRPVYWEDEEFTVTAMTPWCPGLVASLSERGVGDVILKDFVKVDRLRELFSGLESLKSLYIDVEDTVAEENIRSLICCQIPNLTTFYLVSKSVGTIGNVFVESLCKYAPNLSELVLYHCPGLTDDHLRQIKDSLRNLESLDLFTCKSISDDGIAALAGVSVCGDLIGSRPKLSCLEVAFNDSLTEKAVKYLSIGASNIKSLRLTYCPVISAGGMQYVASMPRLLQLECNSSLASDAAMTYLAQGDLSLRTIYFTDVAMDFTDMGLFILAKYLHSLQHLIHHGCSVTEAGIQKGKEILPHLEILNHSPENVGRIFSVLSDGKK